MSLPGTGQDVSATASGATVAFTIAKQTTAEMTAIEANAGEQGWGVFQEAVADGKQVQTRISGITYVIVVDATADAGARMKSDNSGYATLADTDKDEVVVTLLKPVTATLQIVPAEITKFTLSAS